MPIEHKCAKHTKYYSLVYLISTPLEVKQPQKHSRLRSEFSKDEQP